MWDKRCLVLWLLVLVGLLWGAPVRAIEFFCDPVDLCAWVPTDGQGNPAYNHSDPDAPWVIGGDEVVELAPGQYEMGVGPIGVPMIYVIEDGSLRIEDSGDQEVAYGAWVVLCDRASLSIRNATFRALQDYGFQYPLFALGQSRVDIADATVYGCRPELHAQGARCHFFQVMGEDSSLTVQPDASAHGARLPVPGEAWELAVVHRASGDVRGVEAFGEFYIQGQAEFAVADTQYHDMFFEICPGEDVTLADLPELCDPNDPLAGCLTPGHQPIDFAIGPPDTSFSLTLTNDKVFAWAVSNYPGSTTRLQRIRAGTNLAVGLGGIRDDLQLYLMPGEQSAFAGLSDRTITLDDANIFGWHVWPVGDSHTVLLPGSEVGDLLPGDQASAEAEGVTFEHGMLRSGPEQQIWLDDCTVRLDVENTGGKLWALETRFDSPVTVAGPTWLADADWPGPALLDLRPNGTLYRVALTAPAAGAELNGEPVAIRADVRAEDGDGPLEPFPASELEIIARADDSRVLHRELDGGGDDRLLATWDPAGLDPGDYRIRLWFSGADGARAPSQRTVRLAGGPEPDGGPDGGPDGAEDGGRDGGGDAAADRDAGTDGTDDSDEDAPAGGGGGCGCSSSAPGAALPWLLLLLAARLRARPRSRRSPAGRRDPGRA